MAGQSKKSKLTLPPTMNHHVTCPTNKNQHPETIDNWTDPDDTKTSTEKARRREEQKAIKAALKKQHNVGKIKVAQLKDQMHREDVERELNANHPKATATAAAEKSIAVRKTSTESSKDPEPMIRLQRECHTAMKEKTAVSKAKSADFSKGSGDDSSGFHLKVDKDELSDEEADQVIACVTEKLAPLANSDITKKSHVAQKARKEKTNGLHLAQLQNARVAKKISWTKGTFLKSMKLLLNLNMNPTKKVKPNTAPKLNSELVAGWKKGKEGKSLIKVTPKDEAVVTATKACGGAKKWTLAHLNPAMRDSFTKKIISYICEHLVGTSNNSWIPLTVNKVQTTVDQFYPPGKYAVTSKSAIFGLSKQIGYHLNDTQHTFGAEAIECTEKFFNEHSDALSSPEQVAEFVAWFIESEGKAQTAPFLWQQYDFEVDGTTKKLASTGLFYHQFIVETLVLVHFSVLPPITGDFKSVARPKGSLLLAIQVVKCALSMWTTGILITNNVPEFSHQNYDDFKEDNIISIKKHAKHGNSAKMKTVKVKHISKGLKMLNSWTNLKWETFMQAVKASIKENSGKGKCKGGVGNTFFVSY
ncbi:hypothetical protein ARMGADRAFT_1037659 [Armillaria gallica]|uniref:Uncharacterized protein n=1 Tax=Armillaria gallica TaxID=47427 RepID=A0A2H3D3N9_ARMGA|nr:hypothetical protein ARMGADRAFT_1037659 [Armillaria gallica]